jgi:DNA-binding beta-propeller fold protein YncE
MQQRWDLGPVSHWDYTAIDTVRHRLYVTRGERVQVLDTGSGKVVGEIPDTSGVHGVAFAQDMKLGFTSNGKTDSVTVFDLDTLKVLRSFKVGGHNPDTILYDAGTHKLYTFNGKSANVTSFDAATGASVATIAVGGTPEFAVTDNAGHIFLNIEDKAELVELDTKNDKVVARWHLAGCEEPSGLAIDSAHRRLFSVCGNGVMAVTDSGNGHAVARVPIGQHPDAAAFDPAGGTVYSSNGEGTLTVVRQVDADHYEPHSVPTLKGARTMAFDPTTQRVFLPASDAGKFTVLVMARTAAK